MRQIAMQTHKETVPVLYPSLTKVIKHTNLPEKWNSYLSLTINKSLRYSPPLDRLYLQIWPIYHLLPHHTIPRLHRHTTRVREETIIPFNSPYIPQYRNPLTTLIRWPGVCVLLLTHAIKEEGRGRTCGPSPPSITPLTNEYAKSYIMRTPGLAPLPALISQPAWVWRGGAPQGSFIMPVI